MTSRSPTRLATRLKQTTDDAIVEYIGDSNISFSDSAGTGTFGTPSSR